MHNIRCLLWDPSMLSNPKDMLACLLFRLTFSSPVFFFFFLSHAPKYNYKPTFKLQSHNVCVLACVCVCCLSGFGHIYHCLHRWDPVISMGIDAIWNFEWGRIISPSIFHNIFMLVTQIAAFMNRKLQLENDFWQQIMICN